MKKAAEIRQSACRGCGNKLVLYGQTKEQTAKMRLNMNAIFLDLYSSNEKQNMTAAVKEIIKEFTEIATTGIGEIEKRIAA